MSVAPLYFINIQSIKKKIKLKVTCHVTWGRT